MYTCDPGYDGAPLVAQSRAPNETNFSFPVFLPHPRARRKVFLKMFAAKTDFPAVFGDDSKFSSFVRKICYTAELYSRWLHFGPLYEGVRGVLYSKYLRNKY